MPYTAHTWINGDSANTTKLNNLETQYTESTLSFGPDLFTAGFVLSGLAATGTAGTTTVTIGTGTAYLLQADGTTRQRKFAATTTETTSTPNTTYNLYLQPDGTFYWSTANAPAANSLYLATVATNVSGQISTITDRRTLALSLLPSQSGMLTLGGASQVVTVGTLALSARNLGFAAATQAAITNVGSGTGVEIWTAQAGSAQGVSFLTWNGATQKIPFSVGGQFEGALGYVNAAGEMYSPVFHPTPGVSGNTGQFYQNGTSLAIQSPLSGAATGIGFVTWNGAAPVLPLSLGGQFYGALTWIGPTGNVGAVAGQATAGSFGVPVIVAQAVNVAVSVTTLTNILSYTPPVAGLYRVTVYAVAQGTTPTVITCQISYYDQQMGSGNTVLFIGLTNTNTVSATVSMSAIGNLAVVPQMIYAGTSQPIIVQWQNTKATVNDHVSALIERIS